MIFTSSTNTVDSEPPHGSNTDFTNLHECIQTLDSSAGTSINVLEEQNLNLSACTPFNLKKERIRAWIKENVISGIHDHSNEPSTSKLVPKVVPLADKTTTSRQELELLFHHHITMLRST
ncbi:hypothetical protein Tco_0347895, partial [Tanacetum coccineum]